MHLTPEIEKVLIYSLRTLSEAKGEGPQAQFETVATSVRPPWTERVKARRPQKS